MKIEYTKDIQNKKITIYPKAPRFMGEDYFLEIGISLFFKGEEHTSKLAYYRGIIEENNVLYYIFEPISKYNFDKLVSINEYYIIFKIKDQTIEKRIKINEFFENLE